MFFIIFLLGLSSLAIYEFTSYKEVAESKNKNEDMVREQAKQTYRDLERSRKQAERGIFLQDWSISIATANYAFFLSVMVN